jgi:biotin transporter BioY
VTGSAAVAAVLYRRGELAALDRNKGVMTLLLVGGFLVGVILNALTGWWRERVKRRHRVIEDVQALAAMGAGVLLVGLVWNRLYPIVPPEQAKAVLSQWVHLGGLDPEHLLAAVVGFYFGSRS